VSERTDWDIERAVGAVADVLRDPLFLHASGLAGQDDAAVDRWIASLTPDEAEHVLALLGKARAGVAGLVLGAALAELEALRAAHGAVAQDLTAEAPGPVPDSQPDPCSTPQPSTPSELPWWRRWWWGTLRLTIAAAGAGVLLTLPG